MMRPCVQKIHPPVALIHSPTLRATKVQLAFLPLHRRSLELIRTEISRVYAR